VNNHWVNELSTHIKEGLILKDGRVLAKFEAVWKKMYNRSKTLGGQVML
jgi:hypothetical protein